MGCGQGDAHMGSAVCRGCNLNVWVCTEGVRSAPLKKAAWGLCVHVCVCACAPGGVRAAVLTCLCTHGCTCTRLQAHRAHTRVCRAVQVPPSPPMGAHPQRPSPGTCQDQPATGGPQGPPGPRHPPQCGLGLPQLHPEVPPAQDTMLPPPPSLPRAGLCSTMLAAALLPQGRWALLPQSHRCPHPLLSPPAPSSLPHSPGGAEPGAAARALRPLLSLSFPSLSPSLHLSRRRAEPLALASLLQRPPESPALAQMGPFPAALLYRLCSYDKHVKNQSRAWKKAP